jgi:hypothetical protein
VTPKSKKSLLISSVIFLLVLLSSIVILVNLFPREDIETFLHFNYALMGILNTEILLGSLFYPFFWLSPSNLYPLAILILFSLALRPNPGKISPKTFPFLLTPSVYPILMTLFQAYLSVKSTNDMFIFPEGSWPYQVLTALFISCVAWSFALWLHFKLNSSDKELKWFVFFIVSAQTILCLQFYSFAISGRIPRLHW